MAKQTLKSLLGSSDEREQVELNLNPVSLQPTIRNGGNYRVAVQDTPKTNSLLQLSEALKGGVQLYGQAVNVAQDKAAKDVETMSEEDFDKFVAEGLDEESRNIFGYTKAYNFALAKKYYAEEMPTKLQAIAAELHKDPYAYKDPAEFEGAAIAAVNEAYDEADELLGGNVFSEQANNALKSATKADFVAKQQASYLQKLPEITRKVQSDVAFKAFSELDDVANVKTTIDQQILAVTDAVGNRKDAAEIVTKAYLDNIEALAKQEGKEELAQALLDELDDTTVAGLGSQGRRKFGKDGIELFNTSANRLRIEELENNIETAGVSGYNAKLARARQAQADIELEAFGLIAEAKGDETTALARFEEIDADIIKGSVTLNGVTYTDTIELNEIRKFISEARNNKDLFVHNAKLNFINNNTGSKRAGVSELLNARTIQSLNPDASAILFEKTWDSARNPAPTQQGVELISDFNSELEQLELQLAGTLLGDTSLSVGERITEYSKLYPAEVAAKMQAWVTNELERIVPLPPEKPSTPARDTAEAKVADKLQEIDNNKYISEEQKEEFKEAHIQEEIDRQETINEALAFQQYPDGTRRLHGDVPDNEGTRRAKGLGYTFDPTHAYQTAIERGLFIDSDEQAQGFNAVHGSFGVNSQKRRNALKLYNLNPLRRFSEESPIEKATKKGRLRESFSLYGLTMQELSQDNFEANIPNSTPAMGKSKVSPTEVYGEGNPFSSAPIVYNGSIKNTIAIVQGYMDDPTTALPEVFIQAAKNYGISPETMMKQMETYLLTNNFISE